MRSPRGDQAASTTVTSPTMTRSRPPSAVSSSGCSTGRGAIERRRSWRPATYATPRPSGENVGARSTPSRVVRRRSAPAAVRIQRSVSVPRPRTNTTVPSGETVGSVSGATAVVRRSRGPGAPSSSTATRQRSICPARSDANTSVAPSAPQTGSRSHAGPVVTRDKRAADRVGRPSSPGSETQRSPFISIANRPVTDTEGLRAAARIVATGAAEVDCPSNPTSVIRAMIMGPAILTGDPKPRLPTDISHPVWGSASPARPHAGPCLPTPARG